MASVARSMYKASNAGISISVAACKSSGAYRSVAYQQSGSISGKHQQHHIMARSVMASATRNIARVWRGNIMARRGGVAKGKAAKINLA